VTAATRAALLLGVALAGAGAAGRALDGGGDPQRGEAVYARCLACHALGYDRTGPRHCGLLGRRAGSVPGFAYSDAMRRANLTWDRNTLDRFLADPLRVVPGTTMGYAGVKEQQARADLIAYLAAAGDSAECRQR
jgi:cytochrome c